MDEQLKEQMEEALASLVNELKPVPAAHDTDLGAGCDRGDRI